MIVLTKLKAEIWEHADIPKKKSNVSRNTNSQTIKQAGNKPTVFIHII